MIRTILILSLLLIVAESLHAAPPIRRSDLPTGTVFRDVTNTWSVPQSFPYIRLTPYSGVPDSPSTGTVLVDEETGRPFFYRNGSWHGFVLNGDTVGAQVQFSVGGVSVGTGTRVNLIGTGITGNVTDTDEIDINIPVGSVDPGVVPTGVISPFAGSSAPTGWLLCYGEPVSRTTYAGLFSVISTTYGPGNGSTTFNVPDLRGRAAFGKDNMGGVAVGRISDTGVGNPALDGTSLGAVGGADRQTISTAQMPSHTHPVFVYSVNVTDGSVPMLTSESSTVTANTSPTGGGEAHPQMPPAMILNYLIKY